MQTVRTKEQIIDWLKNAQKRQQKWQQEVKKRWAAKKETQTATVV